jgi:type IV pilus assembly protein PilV
MKRAAGFTLIEVLVSMVVLSVALLGTAALTASSLKNTNTSYYLSQATIMADDILDRMRANVAQARAGKYNIAADGTLSATANTLERFDCDEWLTTLAQTMPGGKGKVSVDPGTGEAKIVIEWDGGIAAGGQSFQTSSQL